MPASRLIERQLLNARASLINNGLSPLLADEVMRESIARYYATMALETSSGIERQVARLIEACHRAAAATRREGPAMPEPRPHAPEPAPVLSFLDRFVFPLLGRPT